MADTGALRSALEDVLGETNDLLNRVEAGATLEEVRGDLGDVRASAIKALDELDAIEPSAPTDVVKGQLEAVQSTGDADGEPEFFHDVETAPENIPPAEAPVDEAPAEPPAEDEPTIIESDGGAEEADAQP